MKTNETLSARHGVCHCAGTRMLPGLLAVLILSCPSPAAPPVAHQGKAFSVAPHGELRLNLPADWKDQVKPSPRNLPPTIEIVPTTGDRFVILLTPFPPGATPPSWANLKSATETMARPTIAQSVEKKADLKSLKGEQADGYYFSVTDSAPAPGEYIYLSQGLVRVGEVLIQFTILSNDPTQKVRDRGLELLRTAAHAQGVQATREIPVSGQGWKVRVFDPGLGQLQQRSDGRQFMCRSASATGFNLSLFVEQPDGAGTQHGDVFDHYWALSKQNPLIEENSVKVERRAQFVKVSYRMASMPHVNYYFAYKGRWADVHISKLPFGKDDERLFASFDQLLAYSE